MTDKRSIDLIKRTINENFPIGEEFNCHDVLSLITRNKIIDKGMVMHVLKSTDGIEKVTDKGKMPSAFGGYRINIYTRTKELDYPVGTGFVDDRRIRIRNLRKATEKMKIGTPYLAKEIKDMSPVDIPLATVTNAIKMFPNIRITYDASINRCLYIRLY